LNGPFRQRQDARPKHVQCLKRLFALGVVSLDLPQRARGRAVLVAELLLFQLQHVLHGVA
jgi:hypothetical protein